MHERCANCDLQFERCPGDTWGFWIIGDRIFIAVIVAAIFMGYRPTSRIPKYRACEFLSARRRRHGAKRSYIARRMRRVFDFVGETTNCASRRTK